jgi:hypothetical protein
MRPEEMNEDNSPQNLRPEIDQALADRLKGCTSDAERQTIAQQNHAFLQALEGSTFLTKTPADMVEERYTENLCKRFLFVFKNLCGRINLKTDDGKAQFLDAVLLLSWMALQRKHWGHDVPVYQRKLPERAPFHAEKPRKRDHADMDVPDPYLLNYLKGGSFEDVVKAFQNEIREHLEGSSTEERCLYAAVFLYPEASNWDAVLYPEFMEKFGVFLTRIVKGQDISTQAKLRTLAEEVLGDLLPGLYVLSNQHALHVFDELAKKTFKQVHRTMTRGERRMWILLRFMNGKRFGAPRKAFFFGRIFREDIALNNFVFCTGRRTIALIQNVIADKKLRVAEAKELQERWLTYLHYYPLFVAAEYDWERHRASLDEKYSPGKASGMDSLDRTDTDSFDSAGEGHEASEESLSDKYHDSTDYDPLDRALVTEMLAAIDALPDRQRQIMRLKVEGNNEREIGEELMISQPVVNDAYHAAVETLKKKGVLPY